MKRLLFLLAFLALPVYGQGAKSSSNVHLMTLGTGDNTTTGFTGRLTDIPVKKGSVFIFFQGGNGTDNDGTLSGSGVASGTVNYLTGAISVILNTAPPKGKQVTVRWTIKDKT